jgi:hypothetical protein
MAMLRPIIPVVILGELLGALVHLVRHKMAVRIWIWSTERLTLMVILLTIL